MEVNAGVVPEAGVPTLRQEVATVNARLARITIGIALPHVEPIADLLPCVASLSEQEPGRRSCALASATLALVKHAGAGLDNRKRVRLGARKASIAVEFC